MDVTKGTRYLKQLYGKCSNILNILMWGTDRPHGPGTLDPRDWPWESVGPMMCDRKICRNAIKGAEAAFRAP